MHLNGFHILIVDFSLSVHLSNVASVKAVKATDEEHEKSSDTNSNNAPSQLCLFMFNHRFSDTHAGGVILSLRERSVDIDFAL